LMGRYVAPVGLELENPSQNEYFGFKGNRIKRCEPKMVHFQYELLKQVMVKLRIEEEVEMDYANVDAAPTMSIDDSEGKHMLT